MTLYILSWIFVGMSLLGNIFVIKKNVAGQWLWAFANIGWVCYDISIENYSQAFLFGMYLLISIWGIISWTREAKEQETRRVPG